MATLRNRQERTTVSPTLFIGTVNTAAVLIDQPRLGEQEARNRVLPLLESDTRCYMFTDDRLLVVFGEPRELRADRSPGELLHLHEGTLTNSPQLEQTPEGRLVEMSLSPSAAMAAANRSRGEAPGSRTSIPTHLRVVIGGEWIATEIASLPLVDPATWFDLSPFAFKVGKPTAPTQSIASTIELPRPLDPMDTRSRANVGIPSKATQKIRAHSNRRARTASDEHRGLNSSALRSLGTLVGGVVGSVAAVGLQAVTGLGRAAQRFLGSFGGYGHSDNGGSYTGRSRGNTETGSGGRAQRKRLRSFFANLVLQSPAAMVFGRRHRKYLEELQEQFTKGQWDEALRNAISLAEAESLGTTLSLPSRRHNLSISKAARNSSTSVPWGASVQMRLREQYRDAAHRLERENKIDEAAFVYIDLLGDKLEAIALLERHQQWQTAAEIAEGHKLDAELQITLWWKAGQRERATRTARRTGAFGPAVRRVAKSDPQLARQLREEWVASLTRSEAFLPAVEAGWPEPELRASLHEPMAAGLALGGPDSDTLHAYQFALNSTQESQAAVLAMLDGSSADTSPESIGRRQERLVVTLAMLDVADPAADRHVATEAVRTLIRRSASEDLNQGLLEALRILSQRSDPVLLADLPSAVGRTLRTPAKPGLPGASGSTTYILNQPTMLNISDVVTLPNGGLIVALGESGLRLINANGATQAEWSTPTHKLIPSDDGNRLLALTRRGTATEVHILSLATRKIRRWNAIEALDWAQTYDGSLWWIVDNNGLALIDTEANQPTAIWRELQGKHAIVDLQRSPTSLAAVVLHNVPGPERWTWTMPGITLRERTKYESGVINASGGLIRLTPTDTGFALNGPNVKTRNYAFDPVDSHLFVSGMSYALHCDDGQAKMVDLTLGAGALNESVILGKPQRATSSVGFTAAGKHATLWCAGEVLSFNTEVRTPPTHFRIIE
jgi:hypothetical protein